MANTSKAGELRIALEAQRKRYKRQAKREAKIAALKAEGTPEARKQRRAMNDQIVPKRAPSLDGYWFGTHGKGNRSAPRASNDAATAHFKYERLDLRKRKA